MRCERSNAGQGAGATTNHGHQTETPPLDDLGIAGGGLLQSPVGSLGRAIPKRLFQLGRHASANVSGDLAVRGDDRWRLRSRLRHCGR